MPEFISEHDYPDGSFEYLLKKIQVSYGLFVSLIQAFYARFAAVIPDLHTYIDITDLDTLSHSLARCYTTRSILNGLFGIDKWYKLQGLVTDDIEFKIVNLSGPEFPDHTFIIIKCRGIDYILQSYYYSYLLSGKYGVIKLSPAESVEINTILANYEYYQIPGTNPHYIELNNIALTKFTGVDFKRHHGNLNFARKVGLDNSIEINITYANSQCVVRNLQNSLTNFEDVLFSEIGSAQDIISLPFRYYFSDAFLPEAHPHLLRTGGFINPLPDHEKREVFQALIGTTYEPGVIGGLIIGPLHNQIVSVKLIEVSVEDVGKILNGISSAAQNIVYGARMDNLNSCRALPILCNIIILGPTEQTEKTNRVFDLAVHGRLPAFIPPVPIAQIRHGVFI